MFSLPSIWNIIISTIVFVVAAWYLRRLLDAQGIAKSFSRGLLVFVLAYMISWASGSVVDYLQAAITGNPNVGMNLNG